MMIFSTTPELQFTFQDSVGTTPAGLQTRILEVPYRGQSTATGRALDFARTTFFESSTSG